MASLKAKNEPEKEGTNLRKVTDAVPGNKKKAWVRYKLAEYNKRKLELEAEERRVANTPYNKIQEALELEVISHHNEEQVQLREVL
jgi:hypothetical protein